MQKQRLAIDMDDVMAATGKKNLAVYNEKIGTNFTEKDFLNKEYLDVLDQKNYLVVALFCLLPYQPQS